MQKVQKQQGFTLIELIIVIVILGILAVTAAPRFLDLSDSAHEGVADGIGGAMNSSASIIRGAWLIDGSSGTSVEIDGTTYTVDDDGSDEDGYPTADSDGIGLALDVDDDWSEVESTEDGLIYVAVSSVPSDDTDDGAVCVKYELNAGEPEITIGTFTYDDGAADTCD